VTPTRTETLLTTPSVTSNGSDLPETWLERLVEIRVRRGLRSIGRATLTFDDPEYALTRSAVLKVGAEVVLKSVDSSATVLLRGAVTGVETEVRRRIGARLVVTVDDKAYELTRSAVGETYHEMKLSDVVSQLVSATAMTAEISGLPETRLPFAMRADSPLGLVDEICLRYGCDWLVDDNKLAVWPATTGNLSGAGSVTLGIEQELLDLSVRQVSDAPTKVTVRGWDAATKKAVSDTATSPDSRAGGNQPASSGKTFVREGGRLAVSTADDAKHVASGLAARTGRVVARGTALFSPTLRVGGMLAIEGAGPSNGSYYVREVTHVFDASGARTAFVAGDRDPVLLSDPWDEPPSVSSFHRSGLAVALVDGINDPDNLGRVSVTLPTASDQSKSAWARVLQPGAGASRGHLFMPDVNDEVLVGFEDDDLARPVVLGGLFGGTTKPHRTAVEQGKVVKQAIQTSSGHVLEFSEGEAPAEQHVLVAAAGGTQRLRLGKDTVTLEAKSGVPLTIKVGDASIAFDGNGAITIDATTITLKATSKVEVEATDVALKATSGLTMQGTTTSLKAQAQGVVESSGIQEIKGAMVKIN